MSFIMSLMLFFSNMKPTEALPGLIQKGKASFYSKKFTGRRTAGGERVRHDVLAGAHRSLPFNTLVEVTNLDNNRSVIVRINDRGPFSKGRIIDLSHAAAQALGMISKGVANVSLRVVNKSNLLALAPETAVFTTPAAFQPMLEPVNRF
ncbi:rare lipoprotein A [Fibrisoma limi BUZ 3]|uniref:Probable endolytic peptidoglycan transglycosylase RlpA n=1 Tax=Fibrisoma limi BUZ 3 TaxID=1185876 RepID=I2GPQ0_9BACT|nr:rare lipoprotein A [Fibrisoma limi BUZ 3]